MKISHLIHHDSDEIILSPDYPGIIVVGVKPVVFLETMTTEEYLMEKRNMTEDTIFDPTLEDFLSGLGKQ